MSKSLGKTSLPWLVATTVALGLALYLMSITPSQKNALRSPNERANPASSTEETTSKRFDYLLYANTSQGFSSSSSIVTDLDLVSYSLTTQEPQLFSTVFPSDVKDILPSPNGSVLAITSWYAEGPPRTSLMDTASGKIMVEPVSGSATSWSRDGKQVYISSMLGEAGEQFLSLPSDSLDTQIILSLSLDGEYQRVLVPNTTNFEMIDLDANPQNDSFVSTWWRSGSSKAEMRFHTSLTAEPVVIRPHQNHYIGGTTWSPDGSMFTYFESVKEESNQTQYALHLITNTGDEWSDTLIDNDVLPIPAGWRNDSNQFSYVKEEGVGQNLWVHDVSAEQSDNLTKFEKYVVDNPVYAPWDNTIYFFANKGDGKDLWSINDGVAKQLTDTKISKGSLKAFQRTGSD